MVFARHPATAVRTGQLGRGDDRHRRAARPTSTAATARARIGWYFGNPGAFSYCHTSCGCTMFVARDGPADRTCSPPARRTSTTGSSPASCSTARRWRCRCPTCCAPTSSSSSARTRSSRTAACSPCRGSSDRMHDIVKRGGRVLVIDPRKTETAAQFEWLGIVPDGDAYLLLSLLQVMFDEGPRRPRRASHAQADGVEWLERLAAPFTPGGHPAAHRHRAGHRPRRWPAIWPRTPRAAVYGRVGTSVGRKRHADNLSARRGQPGRGQPRPARRQHVRHASACPASAG